MLPGEGECAFQCHSRTEASAGRVGWVARSAAGYALCATAFQKDMNNTLIVIATYNERENLPALVQKVRTRRLQADILVVDDNSPDGTGEIAQGLAASDCTIEVLHRPKKEGLKHALAAGFLFGVGNKYDYIVNLDGDLSHDPADIPTLLAVAQRADLVIGSRYFNGIRVLNWPPARLLLSMLAAKYVTVLTRMPIQDPTSGFRCFRREALEEILRERIISSGYSFHIEMAFRAWVKGMTVIETPITFTDRLHGATKLNARIIIEGLFIPWRLLAGRLFRTTTVTRQVPKKPRGLLRPI